MPKVESVASAIGAALFLVLVYLLVFNGEKTAAIIGTIGSNAVSGIKALQGR